MSLKNAQKLAEPDNNLHGDADDSFGPDYVISDRSFLVSIRRYRLGASNSSDQSFNYSQCMNDEDLLRIEKLKNREVPVNNDDYLPANPITDGMVANLRELLGKRDKHFTGPSPFLTTEKIAKADERMRRSEYRPRSDTDRIRYSLLSTVKSVRGHGFGFITRAGTKQFRGGILIALCIGSEAASSIGHRRTYHGFEKMFITIYLSIGRMEWVYHELLKRPKATLGVDFSISSYQHVGSPEPRDHDVFYIKRHTTTPITDVSLTVNDDDTWKKCGILDARSSFF